MQGRVLPVWTRYNYSKLIFKPDASIKDDQGKNKNKEKNEQYCFTELSDLEKISERVHLFLSWIHQAVDDSQGKKGKKYSFSWIAKNQR